MLILHEKGFNSLILLLSDDGSLFYFTYNPFGYNRDIMPHVDLQNIPLRSMIKGLCGLIFVVCV